MVPVKSTGEQAAIANFLYDLTEVVNVPGHCSGVKIKGVKIFLVAGVPPAFFLLSPADIRRHRGFEIHIIIIPCLPERHFVPIFIPQPIPETCNPYLTLVMKFIFEVRSEAHTSEIPSIMRISYAVFCLKKKKIYHKQQTMNKKLYTRRTPQATH